VTAGLLLQNRVAIVTGGASGIGRAIAVAFAAEGGSVLVTDVDEAGGRETVKRVAEAGGRAAFLAADVSKPADSEATVREAVARFGALHVAVNNAGIAGPMAPVGEYTIEGWDRVLAINLSGVFYGMRHQVNAIRSAGGGSIVNITSILGQVGYRGSAAYVAAKHGMIGLTKAAALEYAPQKVRVNAVGPGFIVTPMIEKVLTPEVRKQLEGLHPLGRLGEAAEVAELVLWLASEKSSFVTGAYYAVDGGYLAQ
jgi:NAD(P)-dependent dehydrogenase (short-subunit alcohol dehydrogenase family)